MTDLPIVEPQTIMTWEMFQIWVKVWNNYNFPNKKPHQPLLGVVEECCGELAEALDGVFTTQDAVDNYHDAIGDVCVYLADYCNTNDINLLECVRMFSPGLWDAQASTKALAALSIYCGKLCHAHLKMEQSNEAHRTNKMLAIGGIVYHLNRLPFLDNSNPFKLAIKVFTEVYKRDWIKCPGNGFPPAVPA